ncbi:MAG: ribonuclease HII [Rhodocyclaceae bacterium]|nr:ribonuclease HII [Rhodocyclaceae bacterium]
MIVAGVDEAGRGPLAGPVHAAAVVLGEGFDVTGLADSKQLSAARREALAVRIRGEACAWAVGVASVAEIDQLNILQATLLAMHRAVAALDLLPGEVWVDGNRAPRWEHATRCVVGGDATVPAISAASILAKTTRDAVMRDLALTYPGYGFERHAGYPVPAHLEALQRLGPCPAHRRSFGPVARVLAGAQAGTEPPFKGLGPGISQT